MSPAELFLSDDNVRDIHDARCVIQTAKRLRAKADVFAESMLRQTIAMEDIVTWLRLYGAEFDELIESAIELADEYESKEEITDDDKEAIDNWELIYVETSAATPHDVIDAFNTLDRIRELI